MKKLLYIPFCLFLLIPVLMDITSAAEPELFLDFSQTEAIALMPLYNLSGRSNAIQETSEKIGTILGSFGIQYKSSSDIRPILRKYRIRSSGSLKADDIKQLRAELGVKYLMLGSVNIYEERENPELSVSLRIINTETFMIETAVSKSAAGRDFEGLFGLGVISSLDELSDKLLRESIYELFSDLNSSIHASNSLSAVIIPFDNTTDFRNAGFMLTNIFLTSLANEGFKVLEPGIVTEYMLKNRKILYGEIDYPTLNQLNADHNIDLVVTGSIEFYQPSRGNNFPKAEIGTRVLDAKNAKIIFMYDNSVDGADSETLFGVGKKYSVGTIMKKYINEFESKFKKKSEKYFAQKN